MGAYVEILNTYHNGGQSLLLINPNLPKVNIKFIEKINPLCFGSIHLTRGMNHDMTGMSINRNSRA